MSLGERKADSHTTTIAIWNLPPAAHWWPFNTVLKPSVILNHCQVKSSRVVVVVLLKELLANRLDTKCFMEQDTKTDENKPCTTVKTRKSAHFTNSTETNFNVPSSPHANSGKPGRIIKTMSLWAAITTISHELTSVVLTPSEIKWNRALGVLLRLMLQLQNQFKTWLSTKASTALLSIIKFPATLPSPLKMQSEIGSNMLSCVGQRSFWYCVKIGKAQGTHKKALRLYNLIMHERKQYKNSQCLFKNTEGFFHPLLILSKFWASLGVIALLLSQAFMSFGPSCWWFLYSRKTVFC